MQKLVLGAFIACFFGRGAGVATSFFQNTTDELRLAKLVTYRLPGEIVPKCYELTIQPNFDDGTFLGWLKITIYVKKTTDSITLHARNLKIAQADVSIKDKTVKSIEFVVDKDFCIIRFEQKLKKGKTYILKMDKFKGVINKDPYGLFIAKYKENAVEHTILGSQMEPVYARTVFFCCDEPHIRSRFKIILIRPKKMITLSNAALYKTISVDAKLDKDVYKTSVLIPTYLVAMFFVDYNRIGSGFFQIYGQPGLIKDGKFDYALEKTKQLFKILTKLLDIKKYKMGSKLFSVALPDCYFQGAMENPGLIAYMNFYLAIDKEITRTIDKQWIVYVICHQVAHMFFGNQVTLSWWDHLWVKEGLAVLFGYFASALVEPKWQLDSQFVCDVTQAALFVDSFDSTRALKSAVETPREIFNLYDYITYDKGASILRMAAAIASGETFMKALQFYLDLFCLQAVPFAKLKLPYDMAVKLDGMFEVDFNFKAFWKSWVEQRGYPCVEVIRNYDDNKAKFTQSLFSLELEPPISDKLWVIPINYARLKKFDILLPDCWLIEKSLTIKLEDVKKDDFLIVNKQAAYYYRVNYDEKNWELIIKQLKSELKVIDVRNRAQLISDAFNLARCGKLKYEIALTLSLYLKNDIEYVPWCSYKYVLRYLDRILFKSSKYAKLVKYVINLMKNLYDKLTLDIKAENTHLENLLRPDITYWMCKYDYSTCRKICTEKFDEWMNKNKKIVPDLHSTCFCAAIRSGDNKRFKFLLEAYKKEESCVLRVRYLYGLGCSKDKNDLNSLFDAVLAGTIKGDDLYIAFQAVYTFDYAAWIITFDYIDKKYTEIVAKNIDLEYIIAGMGGVICNQEQVDKIVTAKNKAGRNKKYFERGEERGKANVEWNKRYLAKIENWLDTQ